MARKNTHTSTTPMSPHLPSEPGSPRPCATRTAPLRRSSCCRRSCTSRRRSAPCRHRAPAASKERRSVSGCRGERVGGQQQHCRAGNWQGSNASTPQQLTAPNPGPIDSSVAHIDVVKDACVLLAEEDLVVRASGVVVLNVLVAGEVQLLDPLQFSGESAGLTCNRPQGGRQGMVCLCRHF